MIAGEKLDCVQFADLALAYVEVLAKLRARRRYARSPLAAAGLASLRQVLAAADAQLVVLARRLVPAREDLTDAEVLLEAGPKAFQVSNALLALDAR